MSVNSRSDPISPAGRALDEAIDASLEGRQLFPNGAMFINAEEPHTGRAIATAVEEDRAVVLCFADGRRYALKASPPTRI